MAKCSHCGAVLLFGGVTRNDRRFCNETCACHYDVALVNARIPPETVTEFAKQIRSGLCPICQGEGPIEVFQSHRVWSVVVVTSYVTRTHLCCRSCASKKQWGDVFFCFFLGWWGFPFGIVLTPVYLIRNAIELGKWPDSETPSADLEDVARLEIIARLASRSVSVPNTNH